jgi:ABC-type phosphate transport system substrate-binding protein
MRALFYCALVGILACSSSVQADELIVIANQNVPVASLSSDELASIYLLKMSNWSGGTNVVPVNREASSPVRTKFSDMVLRQPQNVLNAYWNQMHFKGKVPPLIQESDQAVLTFVQKVPGAVGYISATTLPQNVKVLARIP